MSLREGKRKGNMVWVNPMPRGARMLTGRDQKATEILAMQVVIEHERGQGRQVFNVHERTLGYDLTSMERHSSELRLIEVKGLGCRTGPSC